MNLIQQFTSLSPHTCFLGMTWGMDNTSHLICASSEFKISAEALFLTNFIIILKYLVSLIKEIKKSEEKLGNLLQSH